MALEAVKREEIACLSTLQHTEFATQLHQRGFKLAYDQFLSKRNEPCKVEILIGANTIWEVNCISFMERPNGLPAVESNLADAGKGQIAWKATKVDCSRDFEAKSAVVGRLAKRIRSAS